MKTIALVSSLKSTATANYFVKALKDLGHRVFVISDIKSAFADVICTDAVPIAKILKKHHIEPDLLLFIEGGTMRLFPQELEKLSCLTAWYGIDTHMDYSKHLRIARLFDVTLVAQQEYVARLFADGITQVFWLPLAFEPSLHPAGHLDRIYDIAYVGSNNAQMHPARHRMLASLKRHFPNMWQGMASPEVMGSIYAQSKLVFNKSVNNDLNMRYFEAMGAGAVLVTDPIFNNGVEALFEEGVHYFVCREESQLTDQVKSLLADELRLTQVGACVRELILTKHTYFHRAQELLMVGDQCKKMTAPNAGDYVPVYLALGMALAAIEVLRLSLASISSGRGHRLINQSLVFALGLVILPIRLLNVIYRLIAKR